MPEVPLRVTDFHTTVWFIDDYFLIKCIIIILTELSTKDFFEY